MLKFELRRFRVETCLAEMAKRGRVYWWTMTTPDVCSYSEIAKRWRRIRHWFQERFPPFFYVQNFEIHPMGHGWHVHFLCNTFIDLNVHLPAFRRCGFGRVGVKVAWSSGVNEYLVKHAFKPVKGHHKDESTKRVRLINVSRTCDCPLRRFEIVGGASGLVNPSSEKGHHWHDKIIAHVYGEPILPPLFE